MLVGISYSTAQSGVIRGEIIAENPDDKELIIKNTVVILEINGIEKRAVIDKYLNFSFHNLESDSVRIRTEPHSITRNIVMSGFLKPNDTIDVKIPYALTCKYDKSKTNNICPICNKNDQAIPIIYGFLVETVNNEQKDKKKEYKWGGCVIHACEPNWFCKRDETEF